MARCLGGVGVPAGRWLLVKRWSLWVCKSSAGELMVGDDCQFLGCLGPVGVLVPVEKPKDPGASCIVPEMALKEVLLWLNRKDLSLYPSQRFDSIVASSTGKMGWYRNCVIRPMWQLRVTCQPYTKHGIDGCRFLIVVCLSYQVVLIVIQKIDNGCQIGDNVPLATVPEEFQLYW